MRRLRKGKEVTKGVKKQVKAEKGADDERVERQKCRLVERKATLDSMFQQQKKRKAEKHDAVKNENEETAKSTDSEPKRFKFAYRTSRKQSYTSLNFRKKRVFRDPHSFANLHEARTTHMNLQLEVDFDKQVLIGCVDLQMEALVDDVSEVVLDTSCGLSILGVSSLVQSTVQSPRRAGAQPEKEIDPVALSFSLEERHASLGSALHITLPSALEKGQTILLRVDYHTSPGAAGLMWLTKKQTEGKHHPYLFTQFSRINARSVIPCQDSPSVKMTYTAQITVPKPLRALMGAKSLSKVATHNTLIHNFEQPTPVPSFLISLVVGDLHFNDISSRCRLWSERDPLEAAVREFNEIESYLKAAEQVMQIPYKWGRFDIVVLPGSYPFGFIESTSLTMITPTLLAGDKSLTYLLAHTVAHGWMGSLVTNKTWEHAWLNEGFAVYLERKVIEHRFGKQRLGFHALVGRDDWENAIREYRDNKALTKLIPDLAGMSPEFFIGPVQYERGFQFLWYLQEKIVGSVPAFTKFIKELFATYQFQSITSKKFKSSFCAHFSYIQENVDMVDWDMWFYGSGMPPKSVLPTFDDTLVAASVKLALSWKEGGEGCGPDFIKTWSAAQIGHFLQELWNISAEMDQPFDKETLAQMDKCYHFSQSKNNDNLFSWYRLCLSASMESVFHNVVDFLGMQGRVKYLLPLYNELYRLDNGKTLAQETFIKYKDYYENSTQHLLSKELGIPSPLQPIPEYEANSVLKEIIASQKKNWIKEKQRKQEKRKAKQMGKMEQDGGIAIKKEPEVTKKRVKRKRDAAIKLIASDDEAEGKKTKPKKGRTIPDADEEADKGRSKVKRKREDGARTSNNGKSEDTKKMKTSGSPVGEKQMDGGDEDEAASSSNSSGERRDTGGNNDGGDGSRSGGGGGEKDGGASPGGAGSGGGGSGSGDGGGGDKKRKMDEDEEGKSEENNKKSPKKARSNGGEENKEEPIPGDVSMLGEEKGLEDSGLVTTNGDAEDPLNAKEEDSMKDAEEDAEEEEGNVPDYREPIVDGRNIIFKTKILNEYLLCSLCMGYFRDAHTVKECLHTFCKSCLFKYFQTTADCPSCGVDLRPNPHDKIKFDRTLQNMVNKIFADIIEKDLAIEAGFYRKRGMIADAERVELVLLKAQQGQKPATIEKPTQPNKRIKRDPSKPIYKDEVTFELVKDESEPTLGVLERPVIRTSARVTVRHLKKFLGMKLGLDAISLLEIMYKGEVLGMEHSLEYILKTRGHEGPIEFRYRHKRNEM